MKSKNKVTVFFFKTYIKTMSHCSRPRRNINIYGLPLQEYREDVRDVSGSWDEDGNVPIEKQMILASIKFVFDSKKIQKTLAV